MKRRKNKNRKRGWMSARQQSKGGKPIECKSCVCVCVVDAESERENQRGVKKKNADAEVATK